MHIREIVASHAHVPTHIAAIATTQSAWYDLASCQLPVARNGAPLLAYHLWS